MYLNEIVEGFSTSELFTFLLSNLGFGGMYVIIGECEKILFISKTNGCD